LCNFNVKERDKGRKRQIMVRRTNKRMVKKHGRREMEIW
jgi:hypothetical protein